MNIDLSLRHRESPSKEPKGTGEHDNRRVVDRLACPETGKEILMGYGLMFGEPNSDLCAEALKNFWNHLIDKFCGRYDPRRGLQGGLQPSEVLFVTGDQIVRAAEHG